MKCWLNFFSFFLVFSFCQIFALPIFWRTVLYLISPLQMFSSWWWKNLSFPSYCIHFLRVKGFDFNGVQLISRVHTSDAVFKNASLYPRPSRFSPVLFCRSFLFSYLRFGTHWSCFCEVRTSLPRVFVSVHKPLLHHICLRSLDYICAWLFLVPPIYALYLAWYCASTTLSCLL